MHRWTWGWSRWYGFRAISMSLLWFCLEAVRINTPPSIRPSVCLAVPVSKHYSSWGEVWIIIDEYNFPVSHTLTIRPHASSTLLRLYYWDWICGGQHSTRPSAHSLFRKIGDSFISLCCYPKPPSPRRTIQAVHSEFISYHQSNILSRDFHFQMISADSQD